MGETNFHVYFFVDLDFIVHFKHFLLMLCASNGQNKSSIIKHSFVKKVDGYKVELVISANFRKLLSTNKMHLCYRNEIYPVFDRPFSVDIKWSKFSSLPKKDEKGPYVAINSIYLEAADDLDDSICDLYPKGVRRVCLKW